MTDSIDRLIHQLRQSAETYRANVESLRLLDDHKAEQAEQLDKAIVQARRTAWPQSCYAVDRWHQARREAEDRARRGEPEVLIEIEDQRRDLVAAVAAVAEAVGGVPDQWTTELGIGSPPRPAVDLSPSNQDELRRLKERRAASVAEAVHAAVGLSRLGYTVSATWRGHARLIALAYVRLMRIEQRIHEIEGAE